MKLNKLSLINPSKHIGIENINYISNNTNNKTTIINRKMENNIINLVDDDIENNSKNIELDIIDKKITFKT